MLLLQNPIYKMKIGALNEDLIYVQNESDLTYSIIITSPIKLRLLSYYPFYNLSNYLLEM